MSLASLIRRRNKDEVGFDKTSVKRRESTMHILDCCSRPIVQVELADRPINFSRSFGAFDPNLPDSGRITGHGETNEFWARFRHFDIADY